MLATAQVATTEVQDRTDLHPGNATPRSLLWINHFAIAPSEGGGTRHFELARELKQFGWHTGIAASDFHLLSRRYTRRSNESHRDAIAETIDGVEFRWLWAAEYQSNNWRRGWNWISFAQSVVRDPHRGSALDLVIGSSPHLFAAVAGERIAQRFGIPFVLEVRDLWPESLLAGGGRRGPFYYTLDFLAWYLYRRAELIIVLARGTGDYLVRGGIDARKIVYVPNGVDLQRFVNAPRCRQDPFTFVYAGAHGPMNGLDIVLDAAEQLKGRKDLRFLLVGDGPAKAQLQADATRRSLHNVEFRDAVPKSIMPELLASADAGLMVLRAAPLFSFGVSPNKLFDYLGAALPVVCNVPGEVAAILHEAGAGVQARDASGAALASAALELANRSQEERTAMGQAGRAWVAREHSRPVLAERLDRALRQLIDR